MAYTFSVGKQLAIMTPSEVLCAQAKEVFQCLAIKVSGLALSAYFPQIAATHSIGALLDGIGSVLVGPSFSFVFVYFLNKQIPDAILGQNLKTITVIAKYSLPIIIALGICKLVYGLTLLTVVFTISYGLHTIRGMRSTSNRHLATTRA